MHVIATAGHVDHGKSTLVRHLTGTDPDRLAEEKARGLTIDLGFAALTLPSGQPVAIIDVPGHVRFLKNMLAGVGAIDACVFVVAATEGWKPQSEEHLRILELVGVAHGIVALTKVAGLSEDDVALAHMAVRDAVAGTFLASAPMVAVDAPADVGLDELAQALESLVAATPTAVDHGRPRLWVDRSFAAAGAGTIVTGTLTGGTIAVDDELRIEPNRGGVRVRGIQRHHESVVALAPGHRAALNVVGVGHDAVGRGDVLVRPGQWHTTRVLDASLTVLDAVDHPVSRRGAYLAYIGSGEYPVQVRVLRATPLEPGESGPVRLRLPAALPLLPGDRFVLRDAGRGETIGGGEVLDVDPVTRASRAAPDRSVARVIAERGWVDVDALALLTGERRAPTVGHWVVDPDRLAQDASALVARIRAAGALGLDLASVDDRDRALASSLDGVVVAGGRAAEAQAEDPLADHPWLAALARELFRPPPPPDDLGRGEIRELIRRGAVIEVDGVAFSVAAPDAAAARLRPLLAAAPDGLTVAEIRDALDTTRKFVLPLVGHLDATGRTRRRGDRRIAGPRL